MCCDTKNSIWMNFNFFPFRVYSIDSMRSSKIQKLCWSRTESSNLLYKKMIEFTYIFIFFFNEMKASFSNPMLSYVSLVAGGKTDLRQIFWISCAFFEFNIIQSLNENVSPWLYFLSLHALIRKKGRPPSSLTSSSSVDVNNSYLKILKAQTILCTIFQLNISECFCILAQITFS